MIVQEILEENTNLIKTYSDMGMMVIQDETGDMYSEAIDPVWAHRTYTESGIPIEPEEESIEEEPIEDEPVEEEEYFEPDAEEDING